MLENKNWLYMVHKLWFHRLSKKCMFRTKRKKARYKVNTYLLLSEDTWFLYFVLFFRGWEWIAGFVDRVVLCEHEDLSLDPSSHIRSCMWQHMPAILARNWDRKVWRLAGRQFSQTEQPRFRQRLFQRWRTIEEDTWCQYLVSRWVPPCVCVCMMCACMWRPVEPGKVLGPPEARMVGGYKPLKVGAGC